MYALRKMSVNGIQLEDEPFQKEIEIEGLIVSQPTLFLPPNADNSRNDPIDIDSIVSQIVVPNGANCDESRRGTDGRIDVAYRYRRVDGSWCWVVLEVKKVELTCSHYRQLQCYLLNWPSLYRNVYDQITSHQELADDESDTTETTTTSYDPPDIDNNKGPDVIGILVGTSVGDDLACHILNQCSKCEQATNHLVGAIEITRSRGLTDQNRYVFSAGVFPSKMRVRKDGSNFAFNNTGPWYSGRKFVREVIQVLANNGMNLASPPAVLQGSGGTYPVVTPYPSRPAVYFMQQPIPQSGTNYYVVGEWGYKYGSGNLARFFVAVGSLGYGINVWRQDNSKNVTKIV